MMEGLSSSSPEELVARLDDPDTRSKDRPALIAELVERCRLSSEMRERFLMRFVTLLTDELPAIRGWAVVGVVLCDEEGAQLGRVVRLLDDPSPGVRLQVLHTLGPLGLEGLGERYAEALEDPDRLVRLAAAVALAMEDDFRGTGVLLRAAERRDTRLDALLALRRAAADSPGDRERIQAAAGKLFRGLLTGRFDRLGAAALLVLLGDGDARRFFAERITKKTIERPMALELCGELQIGEAREEVARIAADPKDPLRGTALRALGAYGGEPAEARCREALFDEAEDPDVRCDAAEGLLLLGGDTARALLEKAQDDVGDERVRQVAATCLSLFGRPHRELRLYLPLSGEEVVS